MATIAEIKGHAARLYAQGKPALALRLYDAIVAAAPLDFDARIHVADCLAALAGPTAPAPGAATATLPSDAADVYRAVAWYCIKSGHALPAMVCARVLEAGGCEAGDLAAGLVAHYGHDSEMLGKLAIRIAAPPPTTDVPVPDLRAEPPADLAAAAARRAATATDGFDDWPEALHEIPLLSSLTEAAFRRVLATLLVRRLPDGAFAIREGEAGESFFFVADGEARVFATDGLGRQTDLARLHEGAVFGEMALLSAQPRSASVQAVGECDLLEVGRGSLATLADELAAVAEALHAFTRERLLGNLMATSPLFRPFSRAQQRDLLRRFTSHDVAPATVVIREGEEGRGLFVVLSGELDVGRRGGDGKTVPLATLRTGDVFGEMALLGGSPTTATVTAARPATVLYLARDYVSRIVAGVPEIRKYLEALAEDREIDNQLAMGEDAAAEDERVLV
jgi:CRP-like cAMP-binding protein